MTRRDLFRLLSSNPVLFTHGSLFVAGQVIAYLQVPLPPRPCCYDLLRAVARTTATAWAGTLSLTGAVLASEP